MEKSPLPFGGLGPVGKLINLISELSGYGALAAILASMLIITYEVMARYVFGWPTIWEIEAAVFLLIAITFIGSSYTLKYDGHISMDFVIKRMKPKAKAKLEVGTSFVSLLFCVLVSYRGWQMWWEAYSLDWLSDSIWAPPLWIPYIFLPIGFTCMSLQFLVITLNKIRSLRG